MIFVILFIAFLLRLPGINQSLWLDEAAQAVISKGPIKSLWIGNADFHPPVFHTILHFWMRISESEIFMRLLPVLIGVSTIYVMYLFAKKYFNEKVGLISALLLSISPYHIYYSQNLRSYSLLVLVGLISTYFLLEKKWKAYAIINVVAFFTNYVYLFLILSHFCIILYSKKTAEIKNFIFSQLLLLGIFIFWIPQFILQLQAGSVLVTTLPEWRRLSSPGVLIAIPITFFKLIAGQIAIQKNPIYIFYAGLVVSTFFWITYRLKNLKGGKIVFFGIVVFLPVVSAWIISFFIPLNNPPRLIFILPFIFLLIAHYIHLTRDKHLIYVFVIVCLFGIFMQNFALVNRKEDWRGAIKYINDKSQKTQKESLVVFEFIAPFAPWLWYEKNGIEAIGVVPSKANEEDLNKILAPSLIGKNQIFLFEYFADVTDPNRIVRKYLEENQFQSIGFQEFNNLGFIYEFWKPLM